MRTADIRLARIPGSHQDLEYNILKRTLMNQNPPPLTSRREFLKDTGRLAAASALAGVVLPHVHAGEDNTIRLALIGCGGRGSGAVANAMSAGGARSGR